MLLLINLKNKIKIMGTENNKNITDEELFEKAFGLDARKMTEDQKNILREICCPTKMHWLGTVGIGFLVAAIINLIKFDFLWFFIFALTGIVFFHAPLFITRNKAFKKYGKTVAPDEYAEFREQNKIFYLAYYISKYGRLLAGLSMLVGIVYLFFNWRIGLSIFLFGTNIISPIKLYFASKVKIKWSWIVLYFIVMFVIWIVYPLS